MSASILSLPLSIKVILEPEAKSAPFVAYCPEFDLSSCGSTEEEAKANLDEALGLLLDGASEDGTLEDLLTEVGFRRSRNQLIPPKVTFSSFPFSLPPQVAKKLYA